MKYLSTLSLLLILLPVASSAQRIDPRHPNAVEFPEFGRMIGTITGTASRQGIAEEFGRVVQPVGDVNHDGLQDWIVSHNRIDSLQQFADITIPPIELLLYKGVRGGLPSVTSGVRIGPTELYSENYFLASGDFDADSHRDIVILSNFWGDTTYGHPGSIQHCYVSVYWGNGTGEYSTNDTTRLSNTAYTWGLVGTAVVGDLTKDSIDDLVIYFSGDKGLGEGRLVSVPRMHVFPGTAGHRWGRNGVPHTAPLRWWAAYYDHTTPELSILDHDRDGLNDLVVVDQAYNTYFNSSRITVFYGHPARELPDTLEFERVDLTSANGKAVRFSDVTGDGVTELVMTCGTEKTFKIFAGRQGQRITAQFGSGNDAPIEGQGWWSRPWHVFKQPRALHDGWLLIEQMANPQLGDGNGDGIDDIWTYSAPYLLCYTTGEYTDQWIDGLLRIYQLYAAANLGDIDGSGVPTIALHYDQYPHRIPDPFPGGLVFIKPNSALPTKHLDLPLRLPHLPPASVEIVTSDNAAASGAGFTIVRDGRSPRHILAVGNATPGVEYAVQVVNQLGERIGDFRLSTEQGRAEIELPRGWYFVSMRTGAGMVSQALLVE